MVGKKRNESVERPARKATPMGGIAAECATGAEPSSTRLGETTLEFFKEGERHEAAQWTDTQLPPDDEPVKDPKIKFKSFEKIARKRSSTVALLVMTAGLVIAVAIGVAAAQRTEHVVSSSLGFFFGFGGRASGADNESAGAPGAVPPILIPDEGLPSIQPESRDASMDTGTGVARRRNP